MRELTFKGYLLSQLRLFSGHDGVSLYAFSRAAEHNVRLKQTLCVYLTLFVDEKLKCKLLKRFPFLAPPCEMLSGLTPDNVASFLMSAKHTEYRTIFENYVYAHDHKQHEDKMKRLMHDRIAEVKKTKRVTNYRIYTTLRLNPGNVNAFLKNGDVSKVSLDTARQILAFINEQ